MADQVPATTYLGERGGWERTGVRCGTDRYVILTKGMAGINSEPSGYQAKLMSQRVYATPDTAIRAALRAIERVGPESF